MDLYECKGNRNQQLPYSIIRMETIGIAKLAIANSFCLCVAISVSIALHLRVSRSPIYFFYNCVHLLFQMLEVS